MRLYNASSITPLALPQSSGFRYKAPKNYLPEPSSRWEDNRDKVKMMGVDYRLPCQSPIPNPKGFTAKNRRFAGPSLSQIASTSSTTFSYGGAHYATTSFRFDIDDTSVPDPSPILFSDDETFSRSTSSTISSFALPDENAITQRHAKVVSKGAYDKNLVNEDASLGSPSFASGDAWWEGSGISTVSSPHWSVIRQKPLVKDMTGKLRPQGRLVRPPTTPASTRGHVDRGVSLFPTKMSTGRFCVSTFDEWETFCSRFDDDSHLCPPKDLNANGHGTVRQLCQSNKPYGIDIRQQRYRIRPCDTATTCDTSNSSKEEQQKASIVKIDSAQNELSRLATAPSRRVPVLLGHILEEKFQQTRRLRENKTTIDEIGFPLSENKIHSSMMLVMKNEDETCSLATTFVRAASGQWSEIISL
jgi:hypothetical protein